jgi:hypothetical protein
VDHLLAVGASTANAAAVEIMSIREKELESLGWILVLWIIVHLSHWIMCQYTLCLAVYEHFRGYGNHSGAQRRASSEWEYNKLCCMLFSFSGIFLTGVQLDYNDHAHTSHIFYKQSLDLVLIFKHVLSLEN